MRFHVHGFIEEGTTTTPFDMVVRNKLDRFHLMLDAVERASPEAVPTVRDRVSAWLAEHERHILNVGDDLPSIRDWRWGQA
jgi:xylulose-5-phosphate/fructose-6-phosphate phosphoketolase